MPGTINRLSIAELEELVLGEQWRFDRQSRVVAVLVAILPHLVALGVANGTRAAHSDQPLPEALSVREILEMIPGYSGEDDGREG